MMAPLEAPTLWIAMVVGLGFGFLLERSGLGSARTIAAQLEGRDFTVAIVMLVAIVTAMLGVFWSARLGWLDLGQVGIPSTDLLPQVFGAVVFGAGFAIAALCPGTACAAAGTGRGDGLAAMAGLFLGTLGIGLLWPSLGVLASYRPQEAALLPEALGVSTGVVVAGLTLLAVVAVPLAHRLERKTGSPPWPRALSPLAVGGLTLGLLAIPAAGSNRGPAVDGLEAIAREIASEADHVEALDLATWIQEGRVGLRLIDIRDDLAPDDYRIPGAEVIPLGMLPRLRVGPEQLVVLYSEGGAHAAQGWVLLRAQGVHNVRVLHDGMAAWEDEVMSPPPPREGDAADQARFARASALSAWFGGVPRQSGSPPASDPHTPTRRRKTC